MRNELKIAQKAALKAGEIILASATHTKVTAKSTNNLVTQADIDAERKIIRIITRAFPSHSFLTEEGQADDSSQTDHVWIIDPLDGTNNYVHGIPHVAVSVAYAVKGKVKLGVVYDVFRKQLYHAVAGKGAYVNNERIRIGQTEVLQDAIIAMGFHYDRGELMRKTLDAIQMLFDINIQGIRRSGTAALDFCWVARGWLDAYFEYKLHPWDMAAGMLLVREAGGVCLDRYGNQLTFDATGVIAANKMLVQKLKNIVIWRY